MNNLLTEQLKVIRRNMGILTEETLTVSGAKKFGKEIGGAAYVTKPVDLDELERVLKEKLGV